MSIIPNEKPPSDAIVADGTLMSLFSDFPLILIVFTFFIISDVGKPRLDRLSGP